MKKKEHKLANSPVVRSFEQKSARLKTAVNLLKRVH